jgi:uracil-DNA glycosylase family 4
LNNQKGLKNPQMKPTGSKEPIVYIIGEAPGAQEDARGKQFVGKSGQVLRLRIPEKWESKIRWNNTVRCRPPDNRDPSPVEIECCRPSIITDIEQTKPTAIFGFGAVPLHWTTKQTGITNWAGRCIPVTIGKHTCWYFPMVHPSFVMRTRKFVPRNEDEYGSDVEFAFANDIRKAFRLVETLPEPVVHSKEDAFDGVEWVTGEGGDSDVDRIVEFLESLQEESVVGFDIETNRLRPYAKGAKILSVSLSSASSTLAFALGHKQAKWTERQRNRVEDEFRHFLYRAKCRKVVHNLAFEMEWIAYFYGRKVLRKTRWGDSMSQAYILYGTKDDGYRKRKGTNSLGYLTLQHFGIDIKTLSDVDRDRLDEEPIEKVLPYNGVDSKYHRSVYLRQAKLIKQEGLEHVYAHQMRRIPTVVLTQLKGIPIDQDVVNQLFDEYSIKLKKIGNKIVALPIVKKFEQVTRRKFRPSANDDVKEIIVDFLKKPVESTDEKILSTIKHPFAELILDWRTTAKLISTYIMAYQKGSDDLWPDGLVHPILGVTRVATWRSSSDSPNSQNTPKHGDGKNVRKAIRPGGDKRVVSFDYAGIQARNVAMESKDKRLVQNFWNEYDIHTDWMERIIRRYPKWITEGLKVFNDKSEDGKKLRKAYRQRAKNEFVFATFFGAQENKISTTLGIPKNIAMDMLQEFWDEFPDVYKWHKRVETFFYKHGYVESLAGFRRYAPIDRNQWVNTPIQADESFIVLEAMSALSEYEELRFQANIEVHDDLTYMWPKKEIERNAEIVIKEMIGVKADWINVPIVVEMSVGEDWYDMKEVGVFSSDGWDGVVRMPKKLIAPAQPDTWDNGDGWFGIEK